ncbi:DNA-directed RNA polymerase subunit epsilon [Bacillus sp. B190/17]|uniref:DNA-directed RNA polymerase subunit epsilon n=1 Tax=Bacillus lumedeiriae TaxID=3058829 RepID=A0ABW8I5T9_9BACI
MIFKVYYQENNSEVAIRENTKALYAEAASEREVRNLLKNRPYNIEYIQGIEGAYLAYEQQSPNYRLEQL